MRDISEIQTLADEIRVCVSKSDNYADTARQKIAEVAPALDGGDFGAEWNTNRWLLITVGLDINMVPIYLPRPREVAAAAVKTHPELSDRAIAKATGVSQPTVGAARRLGDKNLSPERNHAPASDRTSEDDPPKTPQPARRTGLDGKSYPAPSPRIAKFNPTTSDPHESARKVVDAFRRLPKAEREWAMIEINKLY